MLFLVDADVLSESMKHAPQNRVLEWIRLRETQLAVNRIVLGELEYGILALAAGRRRTRLQNWFAGGMAHSHLFDCDRETARIGASLLAKLKHKGKAMSIKDSLIAATARQHDLTVAMQNTADFQHVGVNLVNPFES